MVQDKYKGDFEAYAAKIYSKSPLRSAEAFSAFLENPKQKTFDNDLAIQMAMSIYERYSQGTTPDIQDKFDRGYRLLCGGLRELMPNKAFYPDANSTMRLTYGPVGDYKPADAVHYDFITTANGILEKKDNSNPEFIVPERLEQLIKARDFGPYADENGELVVCFIHGTDITGGNSGSPVMNADGDLIGLAFDGNWEAMSGDIAFEPQLQRTISVDIRYVMWILDKYAGCTNLIEEMDFVYAQTSLPTCWPSLSSASLWAASKPSIRGAQAPRETPTQVDAWSGFFYDRSLTELLTPRCGLRSQCRTSCG